MYKKNEKQRCNPSINDPIDFKVPDFGQEHTCDGVKSVSGIPSPSLEFRTVV